MAIRITLELGDSLTYEDLYRFVDHARAAEIEGERRVSVEREDELGNPLEVHALVADLGDVDELGRPALWLSARDLDRYTVALERELAQESSKEDDQVMMELLREMWAARTDDR